MLLVLERFPLFVDSLEFERLFRSMVLFSSLLALTLLASSEPSLPVSFFLRASTSSEGFMSGWVSNGLYVLSLNLKILTNMKNEPGKRFIV